MTGGADGIGRALAQAFAARGLHTVIVDIRADAAQETATALTTSKTQVIAEAADVSDREAMLALAETLRERGVIPSLLWINAGVGAAATLADGNPRAIEWVMSVNLYGVIWTAQAFAPAMRALPGKRHVGVTCSTASITPVQGPLTLYHASKQATAAIAEALRAEFQADGIGVTSFCPGLVNTDIWDGARARPERFGGVKRQPYEIGERWRAADDPESVVGVALKAVACGGGYAIAPTDDLTQPLFETRVAAMRAGFPGA